VNPTVVEHLEGSGMKFVAHDDDGKRMEIMELQGTGFYFHIPFVDFLLQG